MKIMDLNYEELGRLLVNSMNSASLANHTSPLNTIRDYFNAEESLEKEFLVDFVKLSTDDLADKWYGGKDNIIKLIPHS